MFGLKQTQFKQYDQVVAKILKSKGFVKQRKKINGDVVTRYSIPDHLPDHP